MSTRWLIALVLLLAVAAAFAWTNPTTADYERFLNAQLAAALNRMSPTPENRLIHDFLEQNGANVVHALAATHTQRRNYGVCSRFETRALDVEIVIVGVGGKFFPIKGEEEVARLIGRLAF